MIPLRRFSLLLAWATISGKYAGATGRPAPRAFLEQRLDQLAGLRKQSMRDASVPLSSLHDQLPLLADSLLASHQDSMAARAFYIAGSISERTATARQAESELRRAIALAVKSHRLPEEVGARRPLPCTCFAAVPRVPFECRKRSGLCRSPSTIWRGSPSSTWTYPKAMEVWVG